MEATAFKIDQSGRWWQSRTAAEEAALEAKMDGTEAEVRHIPYPALAFEPQDAWRCVCRYCGEDVAHSPSICSRAQDDPMRRLVERRWARRDN